MSQIPFAELRAWLFDKALPAWAELGVDAAHGGFLEEVGADGAPTDCDFKRVRVVCRQTYVFAHAAALGWAPGAALSERGYRYLIAHAWLGDEAGWARTLARDGAVRDPAPELYDLAFVLFAMAWRYRISGDPEVRAFAQRTHDFITTRMRAPGAGFHARLPAPDVRLQNPHMHLAEAAIAAFEATQDERYIELAGELAALFKAHLFDGRTLGESFDSSWARRSPDMLEPGHHFEWAWILAQHARLTGARHEREIEALVAFAERAGVDPVHGAVINAVSEAGAPLKRSARAWPTTERIKGWLALFETTGADPRGPVAAGARILLDRYIAPARAGLWVDALDEAGAPIAAPTPASILYHLFLAFAETLRLEPALRSFDQTP